MMRPSRRSRRDVLCATTGVLALTAGCLAENDPQASDDTDNGSKDGDGQSESGDGGDGESEDGSESEFDAYETQQFSSPDVPTEPDVAMHLDREDAEAWLAERDLDEESLTEFVTETSFDESMLVALEADAPTPCYALVLDGIALEDETLTIDAAVRDESADDEMCAQQETTVGLLVRATPPGGPVNELSATIVDRNGTEHGFGVGVDSASNEAGSDRDESNESDTDD
ncbi:hypothetical protein [Halosolutus gelatinilyticus]|uniref:hypothetical protein n=1 Tax=Halosolutus gelatinilyticus TaxID=2931975 RepID=UPI001FF36EAF|nr:hypothetical protein [Halosolutus gelatinilyticus]